MLQKLKFAETIRESITFIEQGRKEKPEKITKTIEEIRVGTEIITNPAYLVSRGHEDHISWVDSSAIKRAVMKYNDKLDDYDLIE